MKNFLFLVVFTLCALPQVTHAASLFFDPQEQTVGITSPFQLGLNISATTSINTISVSLLFPKGFHPVDVSDGNSIINFWVDKPTYDDLSHRLTFSGIIPGGFSGNAGRLLLMTVQADAPGPGTFIVDANHSAVYLNGPTAIKDTLTTTPVTILALSQKENIQNTQIDTFPPEPFIPVHVQLPADAGGTVWAVAFSTVDKGSGMDHYEVSESNSLFGTPLWHVAESPYVLMQQDLHHTILVKAVDKKGNEIIEKVDAPYPRAWYTQWWVAVLALLAVILLGVALRFALRHEHTKNNLWN